MLVTVGSLPRAWARNVGMGRYASRGLSGRRRGLAGPAAGYADFASYNSAVCLPLSGANVCPPPFDPSCVGPASAAVAACQAQWVSDPTSCHNVVCNTSGAPAVSYQSYTTPAGTAAAGVGYNTSSGFVPVTVAPVKAFTAPVSVSNPSAVQKSTGPVSNPRASSYSPKLAFATSRGSAALQPGDTWNLSITGAPPNTALMLTATTPTTPNGATGPMGVTDANGNFSLSGTITADQAGAWSEAWSVGGQTIGSFSFTVTVPAPAASSSTGATGTPLTTPAPSGSTAPPVSPYYLGPSPPPAAGTQAGSTAAGTAAASIPTWVWIAGAAAVAFLAFKGGK